MTTSATFAAADTVLAQRFVDNCYNQEYLAQIAPGFEFAYEAGPNGYASQV